jgi:hypothetical protein
MNEEPMKKLLWIVFVVALITAAGCKTVTQTDVVILPEERIFTIQAGSPVHVWLDKKDMGEISFPTDMKLVNEVVLIRQEQKLNDAALDKVKAEKSKNVWITILGSALAAVGGIAGVWAKVKSVQAAKKPEKIV